jgi:TrmH family RNA methyltransferase
MSADYGNDSPIGLITSRSNSRVVRVRSLRRRADREQTGLCLAEGIRAVVEAVQQGAQIEQLVVAPSLLRSEVALDLVAKLEQQGVNTLEVSPEVFESLSLREGPQGLAAVIRQRWDTLEQIDPRQGLCWVALEGVQDPGNLGSILRTGDAVRAAGLILVGDTTDPYDPIAIRASTGAVFSQRLVRAGLAELAAWKRLHVVNTVGTSDAARVDYRSPVYRPPLLILPMLGRCDSLNLAVATGVVLYEVLSQRPLESSR